MDAYELADNLEKLNISLMEEGNGKMAFILNSSCEMLRNQSNFISKLKKELEKVEDIRNYYAERESELSQPISQELQYQMDKILGKFEAK